MYIPQHFSVSPEQEQEFLHNIRVADFITSTDKGLFATFLPIFFDVENSTFIAHVARNNDHWRLEGKPSILIAHDLNHYVSPSWYESKNEHGKVVPTWNYLTAHIHGTFKSHQNSEWLDSAVRRLTKIHESTRSAPWSVDDTPADFYGGQLKAIVGIEFVVSSIEMKAKLSQNRPSHDIDSVLKHLEGESQNKAAKNIMKFRPSS